MWAKMWLWTFCVNRTSQTGLKYLFEVVFHYSYFGCLANTNVKRTLKMEEDRPDDACDAYHTYFGVAGPSLLEYQMVKPTSPAYTLSVDVVNMVILASIKELRLKAAGALFSLICEV